MANIRRLRALTLLLVLALVLGACQRDEDTKPKEQKAKAALQLGEVRSVDPQDRPDSGQKAQDEAPKVVALINTFYSAAFLDPAKWQGGRHPELAGLFTAEAQPSVGPNLVNLAMSDLSDKIERVDATAQRIDRLTFFVENDGSLPFGVVSVTFEGVGQTGGGDDVQIKHNAQFWLQRDGDAYKISAYSSVVNATQAPA